MNRKQIVFENFQTLLNKDVQFKGTVSSDNDILIAGTVDGEVRSKKTLHLLNSAQISDKIDVEHCILYGATVNGALKINDRLKVYTGSGINGTIETQALDVETGAHINGTISMSKKDDRSTSTTNAREDGE